MRSITMNRGNSTGKEVQALVPAAEAPATAKAPARANNDKPKSTASLYARVRQIVLENKTEETQRLGMGDVAYQNVPLGRRSACHPVFH